MKTIIVLLTLIAGQKTEYKVKTCETCAFRYTVTKNGCAVMYAHTIADARWYIQADCGCKMVGGGK